MVYLTDEEFFKIGYPNNKAVIKVENIPLTPLQIWNMEENEYRKSSKIYDFIYSTKNVPAVYKIHNSLSGFSYIGSSKHVRARLFNHIYTLRKNKHVIRKMQKDFEKTPIENIHFSIIEYVDIKSLLSRENHYISIEDGDFLYNFKLKSCTYSQEYCE